jgi:hypothetical protein
MAPLADLFDQPVPGAAWQHKPTPYIVGSNDRTIQPELQRFLAARMKAKATKLVRPRQFAAIRAVIKTYLRGFLFLS